MAGARIATIQLEFDVDPVPSMIIIMCLLSGFGINQTLTSSIPRCD